MNLPNAAIWRADTEAYPERTLTEASSIHSTEIYHHPNHRVYPYSTLRFHILKKQLNNASWTTTCTIENYLYVTRLESLSR